MRTRMPHVAGTFYPADPAAITQFLKPMLDSTANERVQAKGILLPHAGYIYSAKTACRALSHADIPPRVLLIGPDHRGAGGSFSLFAKGAWQTPLGTAPVDEALAEKLLRNFPALKEDDEAHAAEHSLEVILPMLQIMRPDCLITPLLIGHLDFEQIRRFALEIVRVLEAEADPVLTVISSDMTHYESDEATRAKDPHALRAIEHLDPEELLEAVQEYRITMCGLGPVYLWLQMCKHLKVREARLMDYSTSAEASGDRERVVGYASYLFN